MCVCAFSGPARLADCLPAHLPRVSASNDEDDEGNQRGDGADVGVELAVGHQVIGDGALKQLVGWLSINVKYLLFKGLYSSSE